MIFALPSTTGRLPAAVRRSGMTVVLAEAPLPGGGLIRQIHAIRRLRTQLISIQPRVVVSHLYASALAGRFALAGTGIPHVFMSAGPLYLENAIIRFVERISWRLDSHIVCSSGALYRAYRSLGAPRDRLSLIPYVWSNSGEPSNTREERKAARESLGYRDDQIVAVCVALFYAPKRLVHRGRGIKGHEDLLTAWRAYRDTGGTAELLIVGGGFGPGGDTYRDNLRATYADVPGVTWVDTVTDVRPYYRVADFSISPSLSENLGAPAEASRMAVPSIATNVGGLPEIVVDGWNGWLVEPRDPESLVDAICHAASMSPRERAIFGERARLRAEEMARESANAEAFKTVVLRAMQRPSL